MSLGDVAGAVNKTIQQILLERELQRLGVSPAQLAQRNQARQDAELGLRQQDLQMRGQELQSQHERQARLDQATEDQRTATNDRATAEMIPGGRILSLSEPAAGSAYRLGLANVNTTLPSRQMTGAGPGSLITTTQASDNVPQSLTKLATEKQQESALSAEDRRQGIEDRRTAAEQASADRRAIADQASADRAAALAARPAPQGRETIKEWQQKYDYELAHPKPTAGGGGTQGLQRARADSAIQMLDRLQQVHSQLQAGEGPGQIVKGIGQRIRGALNLENAATEYAKLRKATAVALAVAIQGSRPSDADAEAMAALLPDLNTPAEVAKHLFESSKAQLRDTSAAMGGTALPSVGGAVQEYDYVPGKGLVPRGSK